VTSIFYRMPQLPKCGWLFRCEDCDMVTSRLTVIQHRRKTKNVSICLKCRPDFIFVLLREFNVVVIDDETVGEQRVLVSESTPHHMSVKMKISIVLMVQSVAPQVRALAHVPLDIRGNIVIQVWTALPPQTQAT